MSNTLIQDSKVLLVPVTHDRLTACAFEYYHPFYQMGDLTITVKSSRFGGSKFYYKDITGQEKKLRLMADVSDLIYRVTPYGK